MNRFFSKAFFGVSVLMLCLGAFTAQAQLECDSTYYADAAKYCSTTPGTFTAAHINPVTGNYFTETNVVDPSNPDLRGESLPVEYRDTFYNARNLRPADRDIIVNAHNICRYLDNNVDSGYFVPFKSKDEWKAFLKYPPTGVVADYCAVEQNVSIVLEGCATPTQGHLPIGRVATTRAPDKTNLAYANKVFSRKWTKQVVDVYMCGSHMEERCTGDCPKGDNCDCREVEINDYCERCIPQKTTTSCTIDGGIFNYEARHDGTSTNGAWALTDNTDPTCEPYDPNEPPPGSPADGTCGDAYGGSFATAPSTNLCANMSLPAVADLGNYFLWICPGRDGGYAAECFAYKEGGTCPLVPPRIARDLYPQPL